MKIQILFVSAALCALSSPVRAQQPPQGLVQSTEAQSGRALSDALNTLSTDPQNVRSLIAAGDAALSLDDPNGAMGFFARAEAIDPRNARVKAGIGRAMLMTERPREAIKMFENAQDLGMDEASIAGDRGLAYDLRGDSKRAQRDYALALRRGPDPEITRRMALSLAIGGDKDQALQLLEPLLRTQDRAAWRARAFILAVTGDVEGANNVARTVMPGALSRPMAPFFAKLPNLSASQKAAAVHFGRIPTDGRSRNETYAQAEIEAVARPAAPSSSSDLVRVAADDDEGPDIPLRAPEPVSKDPRRRPGASTVTAALPTQQRTAPAPSSASPRPAPQTPIVTAARTPTPTPTPMPTAAPAARPELRRAGPSSPLSTTTTAPGFTTTYGPPAPSGADVANQQTLAAVTAAQQPLPATPAAAAPPPAAPAPTASAPVEVASTTVATPLERSLATIVQGLELEEVDAVPIPQPTARKPTPAVLKDTAKKAADKKAADEKKKKEAAKPDPKKQFPERIWAQIATGSNKAALVTDYGKMAKKSPAAFKGMSGWSVPFGRTRRLLVGPFTTAGKANDFLKKAGITGFAWTSPAGTEVEKLGAP